MSKFKVPNLPKEVMTKGRHFILIRNPLFILVRGLQFYTQIVITRIG